MSNDDKDTKGLRAPHSLAVADSQGKKEDWIGRQLRRVFDDALNEPLPDDIMSLLERIDEETSDPSKPAPGAA
ncbi:NepR family anti-sigma factor [Kaistia dalseonensis]|uniref:Anti-sigma factor NepR domain-containing protein n=1 Tax=Kaistia dalseonensis TaxID=410840 RepID=A0ABU0HDG6_9HYPH|nr:NepR family anti-sigma factor [Kaistia dalseonensis]MCX5497718.1 NepR family anti-sigma factor [Kaistia dalseonensis]MDQ0440362.1 hypothetical protein [Kaistia dalseonensis]